MRTGVKLVTTLSGGVPALPSGYAFLVKSDGTYWVNANGDYFIKRAA